MSRPLQRRVVYSTPFFELVAKSFEGDSGEPHYAIDTADYVSIVALTRDRRIVLVRQFRPAVESDVIELPSGHVDGHETPVEAAGRELYEETGFSAARVELLGSLKPDTGRLMNRMHCCFAAEVEAPSEVKARESGLEPLVCSFEQFQEIFAAGSFDHALQIAAVFLAMSLGKLPSFRIEIFGVGNGHTA